jgi:hypothetical protein
MIPSTIRLRVGCTAMILVAATFLEIFAKQLSSVSGEVVSIIS